MTKATGTFEVASWQEDEYAALDGGGKLTRASVTQALSGDIEGDASVEWLMCYRPDGTADYTGLTRVSGRLGDRAGDFVLQTAGTFDGGEARGDWTVVPGSGTGELAGLHGRGGFSAPKGTQGTTTLEYGFE
jgi:Protein of unknown function (DUF3224)